MHRPSVPRMCRLVVAASAARTFASGKASSQLEAGSSSHALGHEAWDSVTGSAKAAGCLRFCTTLYGAMPWPRKCLRLWC
jgi:hypothetical protein